VAAEDVAGVLFPEAMADGSGDGFDYVLSRTSLRPREVIQFCNIALDTAAAQDQESIGADAILLAEEEFSSWKLEHLVAEQMYIYPGLNEVPSGSVGARASYRPARWTASSRRCCSMEPSRSCRIGFMPVRSQAA
jgi:hypothetical protein